MNQFFFCVLFFIGLTCFGQPSDNETPYSNADAIYQKALILCYQEQFKEALPLFDSLIAMHPSIDLLYFDRGMIKKHLGDLDGAIADFTRQIKQTPKEADAYFLRGELLLNQQQYGRAFKDLKRVVHIDSENADAHCLLSNAAAELGKNRKANREKETCEQIMRRHD